MTTDRPFTLTRVDDGGTMHLTVKRTCERCHREVGDVTADEIEASIAGAPLPPVSDECGCAEIAEQLAMFSQRYDAIKHGSTVDGVSHPTWHELGPAAREEYVGEAMNTIRAMVHLGWAPLERVLAQIGVTS